MDAQGFVFVFVIFAILSVQQISHGHPHEEDVAHAVDHESHLSYHLLDHYVTDIRPAANDSDPVRVAVKFSLLNVNGPSWHDPRFKWNVTDYAGVKSLSVASHRIWQPQLSALESEILNSGHGPEEVASLSFTGDVVVIHTEKAHLYCTPVDAELFPADGQLCTVTLMSTAHNSKELRLVMDTYENIDDAFDFSSKVPEPEGSWTLEKEATAFRTVLKGARVAGSGHPGVRISILFRRSGGFYRHIFVIPSAMMAFLVPVVFLIPPGSNVKALFGLIVALAEIVLLIGLNQVWPHVSVTPNVGMFCVSSAILGCLAATLSVLLTSLVASGSRHSHVPRWLKSICFGRCGMGRLVCLDDYSPVGRMDSGHARNGSTLIDSESPTATDQGGRQTHDPVQPEVVKGLQSLVFKLNADDSKKRATEEWWEVVRVLDRMFLVLFFLMFLTTAFAFLS